MSEIAGGNTVHVIPNEDLLPHLNSISCPCIPTADGWVIVHNSYDGREWREVEFALPFTDYRAWKESA